MLSQEEQQCLLSKHFSDYPTVFRFLCGLTGLESSKMFWFVFSKLLRPDDSYDNDDDDNDDNDNSASGDDGNYKINIIVEIL